MSASAPPRVLVVEDDRTIVGNLVEFLAARGLAVDAAHDGAAALARLASETYDVIVLDLGLPRADGLHVLQQLRRRLALATPVLVLTARDALASKGEAFALGADDDVVKPFALSEVEMRLRALHRRARRRAAEPASHDHVFHSVLGLLAVTTPRYRPQLDVFSGCRPTRLARAAAGG